jgi:thioredoxin-dependent peroxiredoxin
MQISPQQKAPLFESVSDTGEKFSLGDLVGKTNVVLYFYPKDFTSGCIKEACTFRDNWDKVQSMGATVVGVSSDDPKTHARFKKEHALPFVLVSDQNHAIRKLYGVDGRFIPPRTTFVIDKNGVVRDVYSSQTNISKHIEEALETLNKISDAKGEAAA